MNKRKNYIDAVKGISMLSIVLGHMGIHSIDCFVFTYHVPIFLIISGLFFTPSDGLVKKRFGKLIKPYISTSLILFFISLLITGLKIFLNRTDFSEFKTVILNFILKTIYGSGSRTDFFCWNLPTIGAIWFFLAIFWASLFLYYIEKKIPDKYHWIKPVIILILFLLGWFSAQYTWFLCSIQAGMTSVLFLYIGYLGKKTNILEKNTNFLMLMISLVLWIIALYFSYSNDIMSIVRSNYPNVFINVSGAVGSSYLIVFVMKKIDSNQVIGNTHLYQLICFLGKNSGVMLCVHLLELRVLPWHIFNEHLPLIPAFLLIIILKLIIITIGTNIIIKTKLSRLFV